MGEKKPHEWAFVDLTGFYFGIGRVGGFLYHLLLKNGHSQIQTRVKFALTNAPRVGGFTSSLFIAAGLTTIGSHVLRGFDCEDNYLMDNMVCPAFAAALMWSPRVLRSASRAALIGGSLLPLLEVSKLYLSRRKDLKRHHQMLQQHHQWQLMQQQQCHQ